MSCVNKNHPEIKALSSQLGLTPSYTAAAVGVWQQINNSDQFPSYGELKDFIQKQDIPPTKTQKISNIKKNNPITAAPVTGEDLLNARAFGGIDFKAKQRLFRAKPDVL